MQYKEKKVARFSLEFYLVATLSYGGGEFAHNHIYTLQCGPLQLLDLLFHYGLKGQVRGEQPRPVGIGRWQEEKEERREGRRKERNGGERRGGSNK